MKLLLNVGVGMFLNYNSRNYEQETKLSHHTEQIQFGTVFLFLLRLETKQSNVEESLI